MTTLRSTISSPDWLIVIVGSIGSAGRDLLDVGAQSRLFSITGTGGTGGACGGSAVPGQPPHMAHMMSFSSSTPFRGPPPYNTHTADQLHAADAATYSEKRSNTAA